MMSTQAIPAKPTYREIESALIAVIKAGILYKKPKDGKFMLCYKQRIIKLRQAEEPENFVLETAQSILPNETKYQQILENYKTWYSREPKLLSAINKLYRLYYELAKDYFLTDSQADDEVEDYLNS
ncbi:unnamed protein product [Rhizophagus irregularis]|uniref:Uncharacterized protein n=3 Tax=Rhizophagus irregularis TaxID=588596 RepID=A0A916EJ02_9GLOM|nr:unnamed protein product [Rhizophagus irregularis]CAB4478069.1 unnamed protein product [Rhizophagus irregularis]CAB4484370.1 unnamed protein product [Rhizophagus irregularis]CAB4493415.1 unnamed protein product [Rhizophagus irregularis]CAB4493444.1 unnamed protein product [Rhizophagus irregularis]